MLPLNPMFRLLQLDPEASTEPAPPRWPTQSSDVDPRHDASSHSRLPLGSQLDRLAMRTHAVPNHLVILKHRIRPAPHARGAHRDPPERL